MHCEKPRPLRNKVDVGDPAQIKIITKRLGISEPELLLLCEKSGDSIAAITKEVHLSKTKS